MSDSMKFDLGFGGVDIDSVKKAWAENEAKIQAVINQSSNLKLTISGMDTDKIIASMEKAQGKVKPLRVKVEADYTDLQKLKSYYEGLEQKIQGAPTLASKLRAISDEITKLEGRKFDIQFSGAEANEAKIKEAINLIRMYEDEIKKLKSSAATGFQLKANVQEIQKYTNEIRVLKSEISKLGSAETKTPDIDAKVSKLKSEYAATAQEIRNVAAEQERAFASNQVIEQQKSKITGYRDELTKLEQQFNELSGKGLAFRSDGSLTSEAKSIADSYTRINSSLTEQTKSIQTVAAEERKRAAELVKQAESESNKAAKQAAAIQKKVDAERDVEKILSSQANTLDVIDKKIAVINDKRRKTEIGSGDYQDLSLQQRALEIRKKIANEEEKRKVKANESYKILRAEENTISNIQKKLQVLNSQKGVSVFGSATFTKTQAEIDRLTVSLNKMQGAGVTAFNATTKSASNMGFALNGIKQTLGAYASVLGAMRLVSNIREVTAEFELQRVALGAIIQDKAKADQLFSQITQLAVQSPFQVKELITYTKELSAYRIETDQLYDTTKRLADISAGLGVDMGRLILAYGQVSAASVLRGQELRQFTEAGIPLVSLLADKFTQLNGELVTTGEVFELISNRAVSFGMVKEIFADMTNAGGTFYNMQKIQAETLAGSWSNLKDEIDLAMNAMGQENYGAIKGAIDLTRDLWRNWDEVLNVLTSIGIAYGAYRLAIIATAKANEQVNTQLGIQQGLSMKQIIADGKLAAGKDRLAAIQMKVVATTEAEKAAAQGLISSIESTNIAYLKRQIVAAQVSKEQAIQLILTKQTTAAQRALFIQTGLLTAAEVKLAVAERALIKGRNILQTGLTKLTAGFKQLWSVISGNIWMAAIAGLFLVAKRIYEVVTAAGKLNAELNKITAEGFREAGQLDAKFKRLAGVVMDTSKTIKEQNDALSELQNTYKDIIPAHQLTVNGLKAMGDGYSAVTAAIYAKIKAQNLEKGLSAIEESEGAAAATQQADLTKDLTSYVKRMQAAGKMMNVTKDDLIRSVSEFRRRVESGELTISGDKIGIVVGKSASGKKIIKEITKEYQSLFDVISEGTGEKFDVLSFYSGSSVISAPIANINEFTEALYNYVTAKKDFDKANSTQFAEFVPKGGAMSAYQDFVKDGGVKQKAFAELTQKEGEDYIVFIDRQLKAKKAIYAKFLESIKGKEGYDKVLETVQREIAKMDFNPLQLGIKNTISQFAALKDIPTDSFKDLLKTTEESLDAYGGRLLKSLGETQVYVAQLQAAKVQLGAEPNADVLKKQQNLAELQAKLIKQAGLEKEKEKEKGGARTDTRIAALKTEIALVQEAYKKYQDLEKQIGSTKAQEKITELYGNVFKKFKQLKDATPVFSDEQLKNEIGRALKVGDKYLSDSDKLKLNMDISDADLAATSNKLKSALTKLQSEIEEQQKANDFFEAMLGMTSDSQLAADITIGIYGAGFEDTAAKIKEQLTKTFEGVDISLELGGDVIDYKGLMRKIEGLPAATQDAARKMVQSLRDSNTKAMLDLYKSLGEYSTYQYKRLEIARKAQKQLADIQKLEVPEEEKERLEKSVKTKQTKDFAKLGFDEFKQSELYTTMFEKLEYTSKSTLEALKRRLIDVKSAWGGSLDPTQIKELVQKLEQIDSQLTERNPFKTLTESAERYKIAIAEESKASRIEKFEKADSRAFKSQKIADTDAQALAEQEAKLQILKKQKSTSDEQLMQAEVELSIRQTIANISGQKASADKAASVTAAKRLKDLDDEEKKMGEGVRMVGADISHVGDMVASIGGLAEMFGADEEMMAWIDGIGQVIGGIGTMSEGIADIMKGDVFAGVSKIVTGLADTIAGVFGAAYIQRVAEANRIIKEQADLIEKLGKDYEKLQKQESKTLGEDYIKNQQEQIQNLKDKEEATRKQLEAEKSKGKKADKEAIAGYEKALVEASEAAAEAAAEMPRKITEAMTEMDVTSLAKTMAKSWLDAYIAIGRQGAVTTGEMKQQWKDMMKTMVANSLLARAVQAAFEPIFKDIDKIFEGGRIPTTAEINGIIDAGTGAIDILGVTLPKLLAGLDLGKLDATANGLTGIAKNVAQASEDQITGLAAGINTQNAYFAQTVTLATNIYALMQKWDADRANSGQSVTMQTLIGIQITSMAHLRGIEVNTLSSAATLRLIDAKLDAVIKPKGVPATKVVSTQLQ